MLVLLILSCLEVRTDISVIKEYLIDWLIDWLIMLVGVAAANVRTENKTLKHGFPEREKRF